MSFPVWASIDEAAEYFGVTKRTIRRRIAEGDLPAYRVGGLIRIKITDLDALAVRIPAAG